MMERPSEPRSRYDLPYNFAFKDFGQFGSVNTPNPCLVSYELHLVDIGDKMQGTQDQVLPTVRKTAVFLVWSAMIHEWLNLSAKFIELTCHILESPPSG